MMINTRKMRYTGEAMSSLKKNRTDGKLRAHGQCKDSATGKEEDIKKLFELNPKRVWSDKQQETRPPQSTKERDIGVYPLTTELAPWVKQCLSAYKPDGEVLELVQPFSAGFHSLMEKERASSFGLHDLDAIELTYQYTLEVGAAILLAADTTDDAIDLKLHIHASRAGRDDHLVSWGRLLTGLECDPPIIAQFPVYLMMCQSFTFQSRSEREDYVYSALTGVDWAKGQNKFNDQLAAFEALAHASVPTLDDTKSGQDRCFWRIALGFLRAMNDCENARQFKTPKKAAIDHGFHPDLVIAARALDTIGSAFMCQDGAAWLDNEGMDSLIGTALVNDVMDLHTDIWTGETRNLFRLLYPSGLTITQAMHTTTTVLSATLCEIFRGHARARLNNREDGRVSSTSSSYSFCRARHRRIFETLELYVNKYPQFWEWTWEIYHLAKAQVTEAALVEPLICGLKRAGTRGHLPESPRTDFFKLWYEMVEDGTEQLTKKQPLGVSDDLAPVVRDIHDLWHRQLLDMTKEPGWGCEFDAKSDSLFSDAGEILGSRNGISEDMFKFSIAYGRLSMSLPYIAYHTVDAIIMTFGALH